MQRIQPSVLNTIFTSDLYYKHIFRNFIYFVIDADI